MTSVSIATAAARGGAPATRPPPPPQITKDEFKRWVCIYPVYLNSERSIGQGRRVPKEACPKNPTVQDVAMLASKLGLRVVVEFNKMHPRDFLVPGRVRVELKDNEGKLIGQVRSREHLMLTVALSLRRMQEEQAAAVAAATPEAASSTPAVAPGSPPAAPAAGGGGSGGGKGKKRK